MKRNTFTKIFNIIIIIILLTINIINIQYLNNIKYINIDKKSLTVILILLLTLYNFIFPIFKIMTNEKSK